MFASVISSSSSFSGEPVLQNTANIFGISFAAPKCIFRWIWLIAIGGICTAFAAAFTPKWMQKKKNPLHFVCITCNLNSTVTHRSSFLIRLQSQKKKRSKWHEQFMNYQECLAQHSKLNDGMLKLDESGCDFIELLNKLQRHKARVEKYRSQHFCMRILNANQKFASFDMHKKPTNSERILRR